MSKAKTCDGCNTMLIVNARGDDDDGESAAWIKVQIADEVLDACTRQCAIEILTSDEVAKAHDAYVESIMDVVSSIRKGRAEEARAAEEGDDDVQD